MSDGIIDLTAYLRQREGGEAEQPARGAFALWGADGERSRFALPLWRTLFLAQGGRGGVVWRAGAGPLTPFVVLDLEQDPPRREFDADLVEGVAAGSAPTLVEGERSLVVHLGSHRDREWYLTVVSSTDRDGLGPREREDVLFLAGECAGLLFLRDFADAVDAGGDGGGDSIGDIDPDE